MNMNEVNKFIEENLGALARDCQSLDGTGIPRNPLRMHKLARMCMECCNMRKLAAEQFAMMLVRSACVARVARME